LALNLLKEENGLSTKAIIHIFGRNKGEVKRELWNLQNEGIKIYTRNVRQLKRREHAALLREGRYVCKVVIVKP